MEDGLVPISALQHFVFCPRQCALIHFERQWEENLFTAEGHVLHGRVHGAGWEQRRGRRIERGVPLHSERYGLIGMADLVEFFDNEEGQKEIFPVEYKRGRPKIDERDTVQLMAQAFCLEEMTGIHVKRGALFYGRTWHRHMVEFDDSLREKTVRWIERLHAFFQNAATPSPSYGPQCKICSLYDICLPKRLEQPGSVQQYLRSQFRRCADEKTFE